MSASLMGKRCDGQEEEEEAASKDPTSYSANSKGKDRSARYFLLFDSRNILFQRTIISHGGWGLEFFSHNTGYQQGGR